MQRGSGELQTLVQGWGRCWGRHLRSDFARGDISEGKGDLPLAVFPPAFQRRDGTAARRAAPLHDEAQLCITFPGPRGRDELISITHRCQTLAQVRPSLHKPTAAFLLVGSVRKKSRVSPV